MTVFELMERLGGEIVMNRVRVMIDGQAVIVAILNEQEWEYTEAGQALYNEHSNLVVEEAAATTSKTRKKASTTVESSDAPAETPAVVAEQAPAAE
jgi:hypothetical protein